MYKVKNLNGISISQNFSNNVQQQMNDEEDDQDEQKNLETRPNSAHITKDQNLYDVRCGISKFRKNRINSLSISKTLKMDENFIKSERNSPSNNVLSSRATKRSLNFRNQGSCTNCFNCYNNLKKQQNFMKMQLKIEQLEQINKNELQNNEKLIQINNKQFQALRELRLKFFRKNKEQQSLSFENEIEKLQFEIQEAIQIKIKNQDLITQLQQENKETKYFMDKKFEKQNMELQQKNNYIEKMSQNLYEVKAEYEYNIKENQALNDKLNQVHKEIHEIQCLNIENEAHMNSLRNKTDILNSQLQNEISDKEKLINQLSQLSSTLKNDKLIYQQSISKLTSDLDIQKQENAKHISQIQIYKQQLAQLEFQREEEISIRSDLQNKLNISNQKIEQLSQELKTLPPTYQNEYLLYKSKCEDQEKLLQEKERRELSFIQMTLNENRESKEKFGRFQMELSNLRQSCSQEAKKQLQEINRLREELRCSRNETEEVEKTPIDVVVKAQQLQQELDFRFQERNLLQQQINQMKQKIEEQINLKEQN